MITLSGSISNSLTSACFSTSPPSYVIGGFEERAKPAFGRRIPADWRDTLSGDDPHFRPIKEAAQSRLPALRAAQFRPLINAPDTFTPDGLWITGETPEVDNYYVCCGMNGNSAQPSGGIGRALAEHITQVEVCS